MDIKSYCPYCGVHTIVQITQEETVDYRRRRKLPVDFSDRAICSCCIDDGCPSYIEVGSLYVSLTRA